MLSLSVSGNSHLSSWVLYVWLSLYGFSTGTPFLASQFEWVKLELLSSILGWSSFAGVAFVLVAFALNYPLARWNVSVRFFLSLFLLMTLIHFDSDHPILCTR